MSLFANVPGWIITIPDHLKTQEMCDETVRMEPRSLTYVPNRFKTEEMYSEAVRRETYTLWCVPDHLKRQEMCEEVMRVRLISLIIRHLWASFVKLIYYAFSTKEIIYKSKNERKRYEDGNIKKCSVKNNLF